MGLGSHKTSFWFPTAPLVEYLLNCYNVPMFAPTFLANAALIIGLALQLFGIHIADADLQTTITTILAVAVPLFTMFRQWWTGRATLFGTRPN